ncbi:bifunctional DNA-formamidopyrimidine glycosylase/DNA-(apurinic or apyrimidinic site) lyase [Hyphomonas sp.]|uniref:bifunctional DNA-formamidopyrimidine glycosylase/DNA-(apurinic or apyrimidinic site) lyase n=1 Tax=Hyphomonas sp. TaxID=87 RepID=UPI001D6573DB|nr:bifunctional DNA-formamidopyrimidine glycosylase/DNA-(apurinic or apyrimidinic site) lyase [Hyphomonas sp.]MBU3921870.1 bifunctional DNA-formamidopyrimidine glycosylase/DNA-(apurinic or apyrimidinic site) lyase [Alphaproteobacteria bacterium]MBU4062932.1 bifunctional DNA-formamidopyrimidine glycosylase/DNA-(apurinic or apyrimidinic site) lyase [Alphaproteobacteria bacterium]MBU4165464.1 bifunctional DNA-formamidopyrimidine glycosylase/DNA-(apurinic or apyrimidinic site) lyase [Alphaproteobact
MPELPEVETVRRGLAPVMEGRRILRLEQRRADLRFPLPDRFAERVANARIDRLARQAKFLTAHLSTDEVLVMHLGMTGRFTISGEPPGAFHQATGGTIAHDHVVFHMEGGETVTYNDPRRFGFMELWPAATFEAYPRLKDLGPEPLSNGFSAAYLDTALRGKAAPVKAALLDQSIIAGLGNIYVCEALYRAGISPKRLSRSIPGLRAARLAPAISAIIAEAIAAGGSSISDFAGTDGALGYFQHRFDVYDREGQPCKRCGGMVQRIVQSGRSTFYCQSCQR